MSHISELHRYPVKSLLGERLQSTEVTEHGFPGDRAWAVRDERTTLTGKKFPALMSARAAYSEVPTAERRSAALTLTLPDGRTISSSDDTLSSVLSDYLGHKATLWPLVDADDLDFYRREAAEGVSPEAREAGLREVFARLPHEPLPDLSTFPPELFEYNSPPGTYFDAYPLLILSRNALATLSEQCGRAQLRPAPLSPQHCGGRPDRRFPGKRLGRPALLHWAGGEFNG